MSTGTAAKPSRTDRLRKPESDDNRKAPQRDRDRILYTSAFRRLAGVTQVVAAEEGHVFHNRLTHSLQVAQVARRLAEKLYDDDKTTCELLGGLDADTTEAAALAHDLGHPPFGHAAEETLRELADSIGLVDGFEGNAQSFRVVTTLSLRFPEFDGLNLTRATLNAILKYPWLRSSAPSTKRNKWGAYDSEQEEFEFARKLCPIGDTSKSVEAELMDWADDITYAVHDVEDFYRAGLIPLERLSSEKDDSERSRFFDRVFARYSQNGRSLPASESELKEAFTEIVTFFPVNERYSGQRDHRSKLRNITSALIGRYIRAIKLSVPKKTGEPRIELNPQLKKEVDMWKELTWDYVILNPALATQRHGQKRIIRALFNTYYRAGVQHQSTIFPLAFEEQLEAAHTDASDEKDMRRRVGRIVIDLIAGMTEQQAVTLCHRLSGIALGSSLHDVNRR